MSFDYVLILSELDPVAQAVGDRLGTPSTAGPHVDGAPIREVAPRVGLLRRPGWHIHDDALVVPPDRRDRPAPTLVFPSVHRSANSRETLTVHPLGNPTDEAEVGGRPRSLVPTDPRRMTDALRRTSEFAASVGWPSSFEATHHGPALSQPAFFVEIGAADYAHPPEACVVGLARLLPELQADPKDRVAVGLGGGHYAPHFTELALERRWAFGHLLPRHALSEGPREIVGAALRSTPGAEGLLYHRAQDAESATWSDLAPRLRDQEAEGRGRPTRREDGG